MFRRRLNGYEWLSIVVFLTICVGSIWYLVTTANMMAEAELGFHGNVARALGIGFAVILAIALNVAFITLARAQTAMEQAEAEDQENEQSRSPGNRSTDPRDGE